MSFKSLALIVILSVLPIFGKGSVVGSKATDFTLMTFEGKKVTLSKQKGKVILLDFWASWCVPCKEELPLLDNLQNVYGKKGFRVLAVNIDNKPKNALKFLEQYFIKLTSLWDENKQVVAAYDVETMPTSLIIDKEGIIRYIHSGFIPDDIHKYKEEIEILLKSRKRN